MPFDLLGVGGRLPRGIQPVTGVLTAMKKQAAMVYLLVFLAGLVGAYCVPSSWYQSPAPTKAAARASAPTSANLLAERR